MKEMPWGDSRRLRTLSLASMVPTRAKRPVSRKNVIRFMLPYQSCGACGMDSAQVCLQRMVKAQIAAMLAWPHPVFTPVLKPAYQVVDQMDGRCLFGRSARCRPRKQPLQDGADAFHVLRHLQHPNTM